MPTFRVATVVTKLAVEFVTVEADSSEEAAEMAKGISLDTEVKEVVLRRETLHFPATTTDPGLGAWDNLCISQAKAFLGLD